MNFTQFTIVSVSFVLINAVNPMVASADCKNVTILVTGNLNSETTFQMTPDEPPLAGSTISLPLDSIGGSDAEVIVRMRHTYNQIWYADISSRNKSERKIADSFQPRLILDFDRDGRQMVDQYTSVDPISAVEEASKEIIDIRIDKLTMSSSPTDLKAYEIERRPGACPVFSGVDTANEASGGKPVVVRNYHSREEADEAMLQDWKMGNTKQNP